MATKGIKRKTVVTDPEGNTITTKTRLTNLFGQKGSTKKIIKYADPVSSGKKREVQYTDAPVPTDEQLGISKTGGATKMKKYAMGGAKIKKMYRTGGMVNSNAKINAIKKPTGIVGGTSIAPKKAVPKAKYGMTMKKGGMKKSC